MALGRSKDPQPQPASVLKSISLTWWLPLLRGVLLAVVGLLLMIEPLVPDAGAFVLVFAAFLLVDGVVAALQGLAARGQRGAVWWIVQAVLDVAFVALVLLWPDATALVLYYLVASWALVAGIVQVISGAALLRARDLLWPWVTALGLVGIMLGMMLVARPPDGQTVLRLNVVVLGLYAFVAGSVWVVGAFSARSTAAEIDAALGGTSPVLEAIRARHRQHADVKARAKAAPKSTPKPAPAGTSDGPLEAKRSPASAAASVSTPGSQAGQDEPFNQDEPVVGLERKADDEPGTAGSADGSRA